MVIFNKFKTLTLKAWVCSCQFYFYTLKLICNSHAGSLPHIFYPKLSLPNAAILNQSSSTFVW